jgi:hypothetical protein
VDSQLWLFIKPIPKLIHLKTCSSRKCVHSLFEIDGGEQNVGKRKCDENALGLRRRSREFETRHCEQREEKQALEIIQMPKSTKWKERVEEVAIS